jgi:hypothetical protein
MIVPAGNGDGDGADKDDALVIEADGPILLKPFEHPVTTVRIQRASSALIERLILSDELIEPPGMTFNSWPGPRVCRAAARMP